MKVYNKPDKITRDIFYLAFMDMTHYLKGDLILRKFDNTPFLYKPIKLRFFTTSQKKLV